MIKRAVAVAGVTAFVLGSSMGAATAAESGKAYGKVAKDCFESSLGASIQSGKMVHPDAKMTAKTIAMSVHCA